MIKLAPDYLLFIDWYARSGVKYKSTVSYKNDLLSLSVISCWWYLRRNKNWTITAMKYLFSDNRMWSAFVRDDCKIPLEKWATRIMIDFCRHFVPNGQPLIWPIDLLSSEPHGRCPADSKNFLEKVKMWFELNHLCIISLVLLLVYAGLNNALGSIGKHTNVSVNEGRVQRQ